MQRSNSLKRGLAAVLVAGAAVAVSAGSAAAEPLVSLTEAVARLSTTQAGVTPADVSCVTPVAFRSVANGRLVSAELGYTGGRAGMLRARASSSGPWERFRVCRDSATDVWTIRSTANDRLVSAELGYTGGTYAMLRARATALGPWEKFRIQPNGANVTIRSLANNRLVSAELGYTGGDRGMLRARATSSGPWEQFR